MAMFKREDWTLFRNLSTLGQYAGVTQDVIAALVVKELADPDPAAAGQCRYGQTPDGGLSRRPAKMGFGAGLEVLQ
jgi:hypothetical protein